eukprot:g81309.t1
MWGYFPREITAMAVKISPLYRTMSYSLSHNVLIHTYNMKNVGDFPGGKKATAVYRENFAKISPLYRTMSYSLSHNGMIVAELEVRILDEGVHSGTASGIVPSSFRILRVLLDRIEDSATGKLLIDEAFCEIPEEHKKYAKEMVETLGEKVFSEFPFHKGAVPMEQDLSVALLNRTWRPTLSYTGVDGMPAPCEAGNVLRAHTTLVISLRLPPHAEPKAVFFCHAQYPPLPLQISSLNFDGFSAKQATSFARTPH